MVLISAQRILMMPHPYIEPQLKVALRLLRYAYTRYLLLVFTKLVDINFRAFWLVPVTRTIVGYSLFWDGIQNGFSFRDSFERWNFSGNWSSCAKKYQVRDKIWLVAVYWSVEKNFLAEFATKSQEKMIPKILSVETYVNKLKQSDVFYLQKVPFWFLSNWFGKY